LRFDKETVIAVVLCAIFLMGWEPFCRKMGWIGTKKPVVAVKKAEQKVPVKAADAKEVKEQPGEKKESRIDDKLIRSAQNLTKGITRKIEGMLPFYEPDDPVLPQEKASPPNKKFPPQKLETKECIYEFSPQRGCITKITLKNFLNAEKTAPIVLDITQGFQPGALATSNGGKCVEILESSCPDQNTYRLVRQVQHPTAAGFKLIQTRVWKVAGDYMLDYDISAKLLPLEEGGKLPPLPQKGFSFGVYMGELPNWSQLSGDTVRTDSHEFVFRPKDGDLQKVEVSASDEKLHEAFKEPFLWGGMTNRYFAILLAPDHPGQFVYARLPLEKKSNYIASLMALYMPDLANDGSARVNHFRYYAGPKEAKYMEKFAPETKELIRYAWGPINSLAKGLLWILEILNKITDSYGWSIVILTLLVRTVFLPLTIRGNASMQKMAKVQPQIKELKEKYKDNPQIFNAKMLDLYKTEGINPLGGCLPILVQIPVFFALYAALEGALQLRQVPFLWSPDLAGPDTIFSFALPFRIFGISHFHLNPLALTMTALMVVQQHIVPNSMEPAQRKMMALMPVFMLLFLYELPSGLTLYWTVSNIFSILQMLWQQRQSKIASAAAGA